ncbi:hypothetical protein ACE14D_27270, partial [Streptomyces sp. Act-28]
MTPRPHARRAVVLGSLLLCATTGLIPVAHADGGAAPPRASAAGGPTGTTAPGPGTRTAPEPTASEPDGEPDPEDPAPPDRPTGSA